MMKALMKIDAQITDISKDSRGEKMMVYAVALDYFEGIEGIEKLRYGIGKYNAGVQLVQELR